MENAFRLAVIYCDCVKAKSSQLPKTIVSTKDCEDLALGNSRLINILLADDKSIYNRQTLDSANKLLNEFSNITDTMCLNGIDKKRLK